MKKIIIFVWFIFVSNITHLFTKTSLNKKIKKPTTYLSKYPKKKIYTMIIKKDLIKIMIIIKNLFGIELKIVYHGQHEA